MLAGGKREREGKRESPFTPLPLHRAPEWNSLCWLVESEREEKERRKVALLERENKSFRHSWSIPLVS
jgi:hypothetical protein